MDEELLTLARSLPFRNGADVDRYLEALATADDDRYDQLLDALEGDVTQILAAVTERLANATPEAREGAAELFDHLDVPIKVCLMGDHLDVLLAFDLPGGVMLVPDDWGDQDLFAQALARVRAEGGLELDRHDVTLDGDTAPLFVLHGPSVFTATHALWADEFDPPAAAYGTLVAVPTRNAVLAHPIRDARVLGVVEPMLELARSAAEQDPAPLSTRLYWLREGRLEGVDATPEFAELLERLSH
jgi:hypothetical protein